MQRLCPRVGRSQVCSHNLRRLVYLTSLCQRSARPPPLPSLTLRRAPVRPSRRHRISFILCRPTDIEYQSMPPPQTYRKPDIEYQSTPPYRQNIGLCRPQTCYISLCRPTDIEYQPMPPHRHRICLCRPTDIEYDSMPPHRQNISLCRPTDYHSMPPHRHRISAYAAP